VAEQSQMRPRTVLAGLIDDRAALGRQIRINTLKGESEMPVVFIEAPPGIRADAKKKMVEKVTSAIDEAYHIGDTLVFLREYAPENVALDGHLQSENPKILEALKKIAT